MPAARARPKRLMGRGGNTATWASYSAWRKPAFNRQNVRHLAQPQRPEVRAPEHQAQATPALFPIASSIANVQDASMAGEA
jgi:hypothetical protein